MADPYSTEEDQIRALRQWWERNGASTMIGVGLALALVFGWQWWQQRSLAKGEEAAALYQQLLQAAELATGDEVQSKTARHLAEQLRDGHSGDRYGDYASLLLARLLVEGDDLAGAERELRSLIERHPDQPPGALQAWLNERLGRDIDPQLGSLARLRLARVLFALGRHDEAAALLGTPGTGDFVVEREELRGDILLAKGDAAGAVAAYEKATGFSETLGGSRLLELKLEEARLASPAPAQPPAAPAAPAAAPDAVDAAPANDTGAAPGETP